VTINFQGNENMRSYVTAHLGMIRANAGLVLYSILVLAGCDRTQPDAGLGAGAKTEAQSQLGHQNTPGTAEESASLVDPSVETSTQTAEALPTSANPTGRQSDSDQQSSNLKVIDQTEIANRAFIQLQPPKSDQPAALVNFLKQVDDAIGELIVAGSNNIVDNATFTSSGLKLGKMKLDAGERLAQNPQSTDEERKAGTIAQLIALSHMSGLKDVESAKKLEKLAATLRQSSDKDLEHQGRIVLMGFRLQDLQNGVASDPGQLLSEIDDIFQRPQDSGFTEMMVLQQARQILTDMGFNEAVTKIDKLVVDRYMDNADVQLSMAAWGTAAQRSPAFANYNSALQDVLNGKVNEPTFLLAACRGLLTELPHATTLLQLVNTATEVEYQGRVNIAEEINLLAQKQATLMRIDPFANGIMQAIETQRRRLAIRNQPLEMKGLVDIDEKEFDWAQYRGKIVLIDFWATWCVPCLNEIPNIRNVYDKYHDKGFEVISVNMDRDLTPVRQYLGKRPLPWRTLHSDDPNALGFESVIAKQFGITAIPFIVIVDRDGKVSAIHVRGDKLDLVVQSMLGSGLSN
jgi:thiol-disulfide isomerase/thioredoxin